MKVDIQEITKVTLGKDEVLIVETVETLSDKEFAHIRAELIRGFKEAGVEDPHIMICNGMKFSKISKDKA